MARIRIARRIGFGDGFESQRPLLLGIGELDQIMEVSPSLVVLVKEATAVELGSEAPEEKGARSQLGLSGKVPGPAEELLGVLRSGEGSLGCRGN